MSKERILSVGRLAPEKDPIELVEVFNLVHKKFPHWHLDIVGDGVLHDKLEDKIDELKLNEVVTLHGNRNRDYINELLSKTPIFVTTSKTESFGIVVLEAFAYGVPVVAYTRAQGVKEIVTDSYDAFLVENANREIMAKKIMELIKDKNLCQEMGKNAAKTANKYKSENISSMWIDLIEK
jgi:N-acetylglucosaminyldiphosphoundecaprenol N-acetyl-beta-D-mannosaminyltransferase